MPAEPGDGQAVAACVEAEASSEEIWKEADARGLGTLRPGASNAIVLRRCHVMFDLVDPKGAGDASAMHDGRFVSEYSEDFAPGTSPSSLSVRKFG